MKGINMKTIIDAPSYIASSLKKPRNIADIPLPTQEKLYPF